MQSVLSVLCPTVLCILLALLLFTMSGTDDSKGLDYLLARSHHAVADEGLAAVGGWTPPTPIPAYTATNFYQVWFVLPLTTLAAVDFHLSKLERVMAERSVVTHSLAWHFQRCRPLAQGLPEAMSMLYRKHLKAGMVYSATMSRKQFKPSTRRCCTNAQREHHRRLACRLAPPMHGRRCGSG